MILDDFVNKYNGKFVEVAGSSNAVWQCVDAVNAYIREVLNQPIIEWTNAVDFPSKAGSNYDFIPNSSTSFPLTGDVVIFKQYSGLYNAPGHIAVVVSADVKSMTVFEQNYPTGKPCQIGTHGYRGCVGWLRCKIIPTSADGEHMDIRLQILEEDGIDTESEVREAVARYKSWDSLQADKRNADIEIERLRRELDKATQDLKAEAEANQAHEQTSREEKAILLKTVADSLGSTQDLPRIVQEIIRLRGIEDAHNADSRKIDELIKTIGEYKITLDNLGELRNKDARKFNSIDQTLARIYSLVSKSGFKISSLEELESVLTAVIAGKEKTNIVGRIIDFIWRNTFGRIQAK